MKNKGDTVMYLPKFKLCFRLFANGLEPKEYEEVE